MSIKYEISSCQELFVQFEIKFISFIQYADIIMFETALTLQMYKIIM